MKKSRIKVDRMVQSITIVKVAQKNTKKVSFSKKRLEMKKKRKERLHFTSKLYKIISEVCKNKQFCELLFAMFCLQNMDRQYTLKIIIFRRNKTWQ